MCAHNTNNNEIKFGTLGLMDCQYVRRSQTTMMLVGKILFSTFEPNPYFSFPCAYFTLSGETQETSFLISPKGGSTILPTNAATQISETMLAVKNSPSSLKEG